MKINQLWLTKDVSTSFGKLPDFCWPLLNSVQTLKSSKRVKATMPGVTFEEKSNFTKLVAVVGSLSCEDFKERKTSWKKRDPCWPKEKRWDPKYGYPEVGLFQRKKQEAKRKQKKQMTTLRESWRTLSRHYQNNEILIKPWSHWSITTPPGQSPSPGIMPMMSITSQPQVLWRRSNRSLPSPGGTKNKRAANWLAPSEG